MNFCIQGLIGQSDHVVSTRIEHNSVLRPLYHLWQQGLITYDLAPFGGTGIDSENPIHTQRYPHRLEVGTINLMGIIGLSEGLRFLEKE